MARVKTAPTPTTCKDGMTLPSQALEMGGTDALQPDLLVTGVCKVAAAKKYFYGNVNIYGGGSLEFEQPASGSPDIDFWASSIIVEANGALTAGAASPYGTPRLADKQGGFLTIHLYGANQSVNDSGTPVDPAKTPGPGRAVQIAVDRGRRQERGAVRHSAKGLGEQRRRGPGRLRRCVHYQGFELHSRIADRRQGLFLRLRAALRRQQMQQRQDL